MEDKDKTKVQLIDELAEMRQANMGLKKLERKHKKAKEELENIVNISPDMIGVFTTEGELLKANPSWEKVLGYTQKELFDLGWTNLLHPDDVDKTNKEVENQLKGSSVVNFVNRYRCKDGSYKTLEWQATFAMEGIVHATARDITKRKKVEDEMKQVNEIFQDGEYVGNVGSWNWGTETNEVQWSDNLCRIHGLQPEEFDGTFKMATSFYHPDDKDHVQKITQQFLDKKKPLQIEYRIITKNGNEKYLLGDQKIILNEKGDIIGIRGLLKDITERKQAEKNLEQNQYYLTKAQEIGAIGTWELDLLKKELIWTDQNYLNFGVPLGTPLTYEIFLECVHPADRDYVNNEWMAALDGKPYDIEHRLIVDSEVRWVREKADVEFDNNKKAIRAIGFTQDITERKQAEEEIKHSKEELQKLAAHMQVATEQE